MAPHVLHMTATPIPRTLSLTAYGDLDTTALRELPAGRRPVETRLVEEDDRAGAYEFIRERLREGRQAFVVCPLVSESEKLQGKAAEVEAERLARTELREFELGVLHGQMRSAEKARAMEAFASGELDVLVATTVIEVGIDVAERIGDGDRGRRALRHLPAPPAAGTGRSRRALLVLPALRRSAGRAWPGAASPPSPASATGSSSPRSTSACAARARCSGRASTACPGSPSPSCPSRRRS